MSDLEDHYNPTDVERRVKQHWEKSNVYDKVKNSNRDNEDFYFVDGPPFTSGRMHCGTAWGKVLKDVFLRYYRMQGHNVLARPGYDTHGLPIEVKVENNHGFNSKKDIEEYGMEEFIQECQEYVHEQKAVMDEEFQDLGVWMDWDNPYLTMNHDYMETVWSTFLQLHRDSLVSRGFDVLNTCPRCETTLSDSELEYDHRNIEATYVGFNLTDEEGTLVTWTTTPWTVVGHQFVAVDKDSEYAKVDAGDSFHYVAEECVENAMEALGFEEYSVVETLSGSELVGMSYEHPLRAYVDGLPEVNFKVEHAEYVETEKTGLVHSAPGFGHEDYERGTELDLHPFSPISVNGEFTSDAGSEFANLYVHDEGAEKAMELLEEDGSLLAVENYNHEYPHCPRCDTDVVFQATKQWMVEVTSMKDELQDAIDDTRWFPSESRDERFRNTVENAPNWNISRQRYWGTPIPAWVCEECEHDNVVGSAEELYQQSKSLEEPPEDLHRPSVDDVTLECSECSSDAHRVDDVLDVWFDSSVASWGSLNLNPHEDETPDTWPSDLIIEGHDQTRGWFLMQLYQGVALENSAPYEDVLMHGFALLDGEPMSKSRGHVLRPPEVVDKHGRDSLRGYMLSNEQQQNDVNMTSDMQGVSNMEQKLDIVWNVYRFALMYMEADDYSMDSSLSTKEVERTTLDNWVLSKLDKVVEDSTQGFEERQPHKAFQSTLEFLVEDVSRYYVKTIRDRVWTEEDTTDKKAVYDTLSTVLLESTKLLAPFTPYLAEDLYDSLPQENREFSVHAESWPVVKSVRNPQLEESVENVQIVENAVARARDNVGRKHRWPVENVTVETSDAGVQEAVDAHTELLMDRVNAKDIDVVSEYDMVKYIVDPDMGEFGPKFRGDAQDVAEAVQDEPYSRLPESVGVDGEEYEVTESLVNREEVLPENVVETTSSGVTVYVDTTPTDDVVVTGVARDLVRRSQEMRSELGLRLEENVSMKVETSSKTVQQALNEFRDYISSEVRVDSFGTETPDIVREWNIENDKVVISMES